MLHFKKAIFVEQCCPKRFLFLSLLQQYVWSSLPVALTFNSQSFAKDVHSCFLPFPTNFPCEWSHNISLLHWFT